MTRETPESGAMAVPDPQGRAEAQSSTEPRVKGIAIKGAVDALKLKLEEALAQLPEDLRCYIEEPILVSSWYPEEHHLGLMKVIAELYRKPGKDVWFWMGARTARHDLQHLYQAMVQEGRPFTTLQRFPKIWRLYRTSGYIKVQTIGRTKGLVRLYDYPLITPELTRLMAGYLAETITISGGEKVLVNPTARGRSVGAPTIWAVSWTAKETAADSG